MSWVYENQLDLSNITGRVRGGGDKNIPGWRLTEGGERGRVRKGEEDPVTQEERAQVGFQGSV